MIMDNGIILKGIGGFYYVDVCGEIVECKARGNFRTRKITPYVGDRVRVSIANDGKGAIEEILPRKNAFIRPPVANIDEMIIVNSVTNPLPDLVFIDKLLIICASSGVDVTICFNKADLDDGSVGKLSDIYSQIGYRVLVTSAYDKLGMDKIEDILEGRTVAFSGFSGVGKSSLLNCVMKDNIMQTGEVSERLRRGKHTTRHVELIPCNGGYIADTPGFSMLDFPESVNKDNLKDYFPEFSEFESLCKFRGCNHMGNSKVCAICDFAEKGMISRSRYNNYKDFYNILKDRKEWKK